MKKLSVQTSIVDSQLNNRYPVIVGVSGGVDSMALLYALIKNHYHAIVCHINHGLREDSPKEADFVENIAKELKIPFEKTELVLTSDQNIQDQGHQLRLAFFKQIAHKYKTYQIVLAHHLDDQFEHHIIQLVRGTHIDSWKGMQKANKIDEFLIIRPFLNLPKAALINYAVENQISYINDDSNSSDKYLRNRIRNHIIPHLKKENPNILESFQKNIQDLNAVFIHNHIDSLIHKGPKKWVDYLRFKNESDYVQKKLLRLIIQDLNPKLFLSDAFIDMMRDRLNKSGENVRFKIDESHFLTCNYGQIKAIKISAPVPEPIQITTIGGYPFGEDKTIILTFEKNPHISQNWIEIWYNETTFPITIRTPLPGDKIEFDYGHKKISRFFQDHKIPYHQRVYQTVVESNQQVVGILSLNITSKRSLKDEKKLYIYEVNNA